MKLKDFFKGITFRCIVVLLCIALVSGGLLSILNDVLAVGEEEKLQRVIDKLYDDPDVTATVYELSEEEAENSYGTINAVYEVSDGNLIVNSTGAGGYKGGTVTVWTVVLIDNGSFAGIQSVSIDSYDKQTLMSQLNSKFISVYSANNDALVEGVYFSTAEDGESITSISTGATMSSNATNNAVNAAIKFAKIYTGEEAVSDLVNPDSVKNVSFEVNGSAVTYTFTAVSVSTGMPNNYEMKVVVDEGKITTIEILSDGATSGYDAKAKSVADYIGMTASDLQALLSSSEIQTGATNSNKTIVNALIHATANYDYYLAGPVLVDPVKDMIDNLYGEGSVTYTEIENVDEDITVTEYGTIEKIYELSNGEIIVSVGSDTTIYLLVKEDGSVEAISSEATEENKKAAEAFYGYYAGEVKVLPYRRYVKDVSATISGKNLTLKLTAISVQSGMPDDYTLSIVVNSGVISRVTITSGATHGYDQYENKATAYRNMSYEDLLAYLDSDDIKTGATNSNKTVVNALLYATYNYDYYVNGDLVNGGSVSDVTTSVNGTAVTYSLTAKSVAGGMPNNYALEVTVDNGVITALTVKTDGSTSGYGEKAYAVENYIGMGTEELEAFLSSSDIKTGATNSNKTIVNALVFTTANYEYYLTGGNA